MTCKSQGFEFIEHVLVPSTVAQTHVQGRP